MKTNSHILTIVKTELRQRRMYLMWWSIAIVALISLTVLAYGSIREQSAELSDAFSNLSDSIGSFVGTTDMFSPVGYLNSQLYFITLPILFILLSVTLAGSLLNKEESNRTIELLLARPISRTHLLLAKALAGVAVVTALGIVTAVITWLCCLAADIDIPALDIFLTTAVMVVFSGSFGALAFMLFAASRLTRRLAVPVAIIVSFGGYILSSLSGMVDSLSWAAKLLPYHYYDPGAMLNGKYGGGLFAYIAAIYIVSLVVAIAGFRRRDID